MADSTNDFEALASLPHVWQQAARDYMLAANYLLDWHDPTRGNQDAARYTITSGGIAPVMVLYATAIENYLKAIRIARGEAAVVNGALSKTFKHHNLRSHAASAGLSLSDDESDLLGHLADFMEAGRYPVPVAAGKTPRAWQFTYPNDIERVWTLAEHLEAALRETRRGMSVSRDLRVR